VNADLSLESRALHAYEDGHAALDALALRHKDTLDFRGWHDEFGGRTKLDHAVAFAAREVLSGGDGADDVPRDFA
jgi:hypothetical protein